MKTSTRYFINNLIICTFVFWVFKNDSQKEFLFMALLVYNGFFYTITQLEKNQRR